MAKRDKRYEVRVMCGPPASGKSTYISGIIEDLGDEAIVLSPDQNIIDACGGSYDWTWWRAKDAWKKAYEDLSEIMSKQSHRIIIYDATMTNPKGRKEMIRNLAKFDSNGKYLSVLIMMPVVDVEELVRRDAERERGAVGQEVIEQHVYNLQKSPPKQEEGWDRIEQL